MDKRVEVIIKRISVVPDVLKTTDQEDYVDSSLIRFFKIIT